MDTDRSVREQMVAGASRLFSKQGHSATTMRAVVEEAGTPWGSVHHYFPGGKEQLSVEAVRYGDESVLAMMRAFLSAHASVADAVQAYFDTLAEAVAGAGFVYGCPVGTVALEVVTRDTTVRAVTQEVLTGWVRLWADALEERGVAARRAGELGLLVVVNVEGALLMSRVTRSADALRLAGQMTSQLIEAGQAGA